MSILRNPILYVRLLIVSSLTLIEVFIFSVNSQGQPLENETLKVAILYNEDYKEYTQDLPEIFSEELNDISTVDIDPIPYQKNSLNGLYKKTLGDYHIVIGPTDSESMKRICEYGSCDNFRSSSLLVAPLVSAWPSNYKGLIPNVVKTSATVSQKVQEVVYELRYLGAESIGIAYEDDRWGNQIVNEFISNTEFNPQLRPMISGRRDNYEGFIKTLAENKTQAVILAPHEVDRLKYFLQNIMDENKRSINEYKPIIYLFGDYRLDTLKNTGLDLKLLNRFKVFGITESYFITEQVEEQINYQTIGSILRYAIKESSNIDSVTTLFKNFFCQENCQGIKRMSIPENELLTWRARNIVSRRDKKLLTTYQIKYHKGELVKKLVKPFADDSQIRYINEENKVIIEATLISDFWNWVKEIFNYEWFKKRLDD
ncbi:MAG: hypothetical protein AAF632_24480 [Bacteroidota bacterium]